MFFKSKDCWLWGLKRRRLLSLHDVFNGPIAKRLFSIELHPQNSHMKLLTQKKNRDLMIDGEARVM